jgi:hypothetical protein
MNARPYIFGCLCLVGAAGTAAASDIDPATGLLAPSGAGSSASFEGSARSSQGPRDGGGGDVMPSRTRGSNRGKAPPPVTSPIEMDDGTHDDAMPLRSSTPSWQSLLPGSML